jgi:hypothetical protein
MLDFFSICECLCFELGQWPSVFFNALQFAIIMCFKFKEKIINPIVQVNLIDDDSKVAFELGLLAFNTKREVCDGTKTFFFNKEIF